jgi:hypothetical protein
VISKSCLGILVVYEPSRAKYALEKFEYLIAGTFKDFSIKIVTNNIEVEGDVLGSNTCAEFSGWEEGLSGSNYEDYDLIIFANDTLGSRKPFDFVEKTSFLNKLSVVTTANRLFLVGGLSWHINYRLFFRRQKFVLKWVRTDLFAMSPVAINKINGVSLSEEKILPMVKAERGGDLIVSQKLPEVIRCRVHDWLNPATPTLGWHGSKQASKSLKRLKAKCVLQELDLTKRCISAGVPIYSTAKVRKRDYILNLLYHLQSCFKG